MHNHRFWGPFTFDSKAFASKWVSKSNIPDCVWRDNISTINKFHIENHTILFLLFVPGLGLRTIWWMQLLGQEDQGNLGEVGRCQNPGLTYFYISPCFYSIYPSLLCCILLFFSSSIAFLPLRRLCVFPSNGCDWNIRKFSSMYRSISHVFTRLLR